MQGIANSCTAYAGCMASSLRDGTAMRAVKAARAWPPDKPRLSTWAPGHLGTWARGYINQQPGWQSTLTHMIGKQCTLPTGAGRFVGLRCNITQYLHVIIDTRAYEYNNVF